MISGIGILFTLVITLRLVYYGWAGYFLLKTRNTKAHSAALVAPPVSVIICARNEAQNLQQNLPAVLEQEYPCFEVVVVNDASVDESAQILKEFQKKHAHLKVVAIFPSEKLTAGGKRQALQKGIAEARYPCLLLTDADCCPASNNWIALMAQQFSENKQIVLGFGPYIATGSFLNNFIQYETLHTALQYFSFAFAGLPYMGVGRNLAYTKPLFYASGGFNGQMHLASGDDDLLVNRAATGNNTTFQIQPPSFCYSAAPDGWRAWFRQKARHAGAGKYYQKKHVFLLSCLSVVHFLFYGMLIAAWFVPFANRLLWLLWLFAWLVQWTVFVLAGSRFKTKGMVAAPFYDVVFLLYFLAFAPFALTTKQVKWTRLIQYL